MSELGIHKLLELSKQAKKSKDYDLEKDYLNQALTLAPTNTKLINALIRNLRREGNILELKKWLEILYSLNQDGKILFELIQLEQNAGDLRRVKALLLENERISPNNKKIKKRIQKIESLERTQVINSTLFALTEEDLELIKSVRKIIYGENDFSNKYNSVLALLGSQSEEIILSVLSELYKNELLDSSALSLIKRYKESLKVADGKKTKLVNVLSELVSSKKTKRYHWSNFWLSNAAILQGGKDSPKVLVKNSLEKWLV